MARVVASPAAVVLAAMAAAWSARASDEARPPRTAPDPVYFEDRVQPYLLTSCAFSGCPGGAGAGRLILEKADFTGRMEPESTERNRRLVEEFVRFGAPLESRLLLKPLRKKDGGLDHSGKQYDFAKGSEAYRLLAEWIEGVELEDVPPIADAGEPREAKVGETVVLDGSGSRERRGRAIRYDWSLTSMPEGSAPLLKGSDSARPELRVDREGAYTLSLVVDNGDRRSESSTVTVRVDALPLLLREGEALAPGEGGDAGFHVYRDPAASGGAVLRVGQLPGEGAVARARGVITLPEAGPYRILARVRRPEPSGELAPLRFAIDGGEPQGIDLQAVGDRYAFLPVGAASGPAALEEASLRVLAGAAETRGGRLWFSGTPERPALLHFDASGREGSIELALRVDAASERELSESLALVLFDAADPRNARFAGLWPGRGRVVLGRFRDGEREVLAERRVPLRPGIEHRLRVELRGASAILFASDDGAELGEAAEALQAEYGAPPASGAVGLYTTCRSSVDDVTLTLDGRERLRTGFDAEGRPRGHLAAGEHVLEVSAEGSPAPLLDQVLVVRADLAEGGGSERATREVRALHLDLLGRTPLPMEQLVCAGLERERLVERLTDSIEFWECLYEDELYYFLLLDNFRPRTPQMESIPARLANGQLDLRAAVQEIVISQYFDARNPGNDTFVSVVLEQLLGITVQDEPKLLEAGKRMYDGYESQLFGRRGASQSDVVRIVLEQPEFATRLIARQYRRLLREEPPAGALEEWAARFRADPRAFPHLVREWLRSDAYSRALQTRRAKSDFQWIRALFVDLLERRPTFQEFRNFRNAVQSLSDSTPLRTVLAKVILDSGQVPLPEVKGLDAPAFVEDAFRRFLARSPNAAELERFAKAITAEGGSPRAVLQAILGSAEYQSY